VLDGQDHPRGDGCGNLQVRPVKPIGQPLAEVKAPADAFAEAERNDEAGAAASVDDQAIPRPFRVEIG
jgi:hypothetical protein